jgi:hypothetical protein
MRYPRLLALLLSATLSAPLAAQTLPVEDSVLRRIWALGMDSSQTYPLAQALMDSIGPRLTGSPGLRAGQQWLRAMYDRWGISARTEPYGTWRGWRRGVTHLDLIEPRLRTLEATLLAWSPGTKGAAEGRVIILPDVADSAAFQQWLPNARNTFVLISYPQPTCRPDSSYKQFALPDSYDRMIKDRQAGRDAWAARLKHTGLAPADLSLALGKAGARGIVSNLWSAGWGVDKIFGTRNELAPSVDVSCEDYGLLYRLAEHNQGPKLRLEGQGELTGETPVANVIAEIKGGEKPDEYVMLSAHFDSWDGGSGATDNGTGTITMLEAMRILRQVLPHPRRTILVGHWSGEEQGLIGSRAFAADHPEIVKGLQALFNQDNGTGRVQNLSMQGLTGAAALWGGWLSRLPTELTSELKIGLPGNPGSGGTDNASFVCYGAPAFGLGSLPWEYFTYTWHTNRDTFDKVVFDEVRANATMTAMLAYLASESDETMPRAQRVIPPRDGQPGAWPACTVPARKSSESTR